MKGGEEFVVYFIIYHIWVFFVSQSKCFSFDDWFNIYLYLNIYYMMAMFDPNFVKSFCAIFIECIVIFIVFLHVVCLLFLIFF